MNASTPPKHKTPNYKLVSHSHTYTGVFGQPRTRIISTWDVQPLRPSRKDLRS